MAYITEIIELQRAIREVQKVVEEIKNTMKSKEQATNDSNKPLTLNEYQEKAHETAVFDGNNWLIYIAMKLSAEAGEFNAKIADALYRDKEGIDFQKLDL